MVRNCHRPSFGLAGITIFWGEVMERFYTDRAMWGFGFYFGKNRNSKRNFISENYVTVNYSEEDAPEFIEMMKEIKVGDIVYLKSWGIRNNKLHICAVGIVTSEMNTENNRISVNWLLDDINVEIFPNKRYRQRVASIYKEYNNDIKKLIFNLLNENNFISNCVGEYYYE